MSETTQADTTAGATPGSTRPPARQQRKPKPPPTDLGPIQVLRHTGLAEWQWDAGMAAGLVPPADVDGRRWSVAVVDAATGDTLLDSLINPGCPIQPGAYWVHGISDADVVDARPWAEVLPELLRVTEGRTVLAYNAHFDAGVIAWHTHRDGLDLGHLADQHRWACLMGRRSDWQMRRRWLPLGGGHRALGDCQTFLEHLKRMTAPRGVTVGSRIWGMVGAAGCRPDMRNLAPVAP